MSDMREIVQGLTVALAAVRERLPGLDSREPLRVLIGPSGIRVVA